MAETQQIYLSFYLISPLAIMTLLSGIFGQAFTSFLPETLISIVASILFFIFGFKSKEVRWTKIWVLKKSHEVERRY